MHSTIKRRIIIMTIILDVHINFVSNEALLCKTRSVLQ